MHRHRDGERTRGTADPAVPGRGGGAGIPGKATLVGSAPAMALPPALRARLERALAADLSAVRVGEDPAVAELGARAHADGTDVLFAPGQYRPDSPEGQLLIAHEVVHLVQQAEGRVAANATIGDRAVNADRGLEGEADELAARALRGEQVRTSAPALRPAGGPIQGKFGESVANFFTPYPTNEGDALAQAARAAGKNQFETWNDIKRDARTGLLPDEEKLVHEFVVQSERYLKTWLDKRGAKGSADLRFEHGGDMAELYARFRDDFATRGTLYDAYLEAARRLKIGANKQLVREIRMFAPDLLGDHAKMLGIDDKDAKPCHKYEFRAEWAGGEQASGWGVKGGVVTRRIRVRYSNDQIPGISWEQSVELSGFVLGFSVTPKTGKKLKKGESEIKPSASGELPGSWKAAEAPHRTYLGPDFFDGADYTRPSAGLSGKLGSLKVGVPIAHLLITKGGDKLSWELPWNVKVSGSMSETSLKDGLAPSAEAEAVIEAGTSGLVGDVEYHPGKWDKLHYDKAPENDEWTVLHAARIHFPTGKASIGPEDLTTMREVVEAIHDRDKMPGYEGQIFKIEISGCHSRKWDHYDDELKKFDGRDPETFTSAERKELKDLEGLKQAENDALAYERATNTSEVLQALLGSLHSRMHKGVMKESKLVDPTTHEPTSKDAYGNLAEERSATIIVSYQLHTPDGQVPSDVPIDQAADNRRAADEMARDD